MGKSDKSGLGRALVKHHNYKIQESKEKGQLYYKQHKKVLESITDVADIDAVIQQADEAVRLFSADNPTAVNTLIDLESGSSISEMTPEEKKEHQKIEEALHASSLSVPRRPEWNAKMSVEELDANERRAFLIWRRSLARLEENDSLVLTPFEKNLDIWRQLWRVLERSDLLVMVVDARNPLFYRCPDLEAYAREIDEHKRTLLLINKADLLPYSVRLKWAEYFKLHGILYLFWSAKAATAELEGKKPVSPLQEPVNNDTKLLGREELLSRLQSEAEEIVLMRTNSQSKYQQQSIDHVTVGFVGYPNVGKSSTINALVGAKRTGVTSTPGKTKHFQTLIITEKLTLCDCPGLVFPSFTSSRYEMIASGVLPIHRMTEHREAVQVVADRVPRHVIESVYNIKLPKPKPYEPKNRPPFASELFRSYCASRGYVASSGLPDETKAARLILKDYIDGKLAHYQMPPGMSHEADSENANASDYSEGDESESESEATEERGGGKLDDVMDDLKSCPFEDVYVSIPRGGPIFVSDMVGPLTSVSEFQSCVEDELKDLRKELCLDITEQHQEEISVDELKILSEEELVDIAFQASLKDDPSPSSQECSYGTTNDVNLECSVKSGLDEDYAPPNDLPRRSKRNTVNQGVSKKNKRVTKKDTINEEDYMAEVEKLAKIKQKQEQDKSTATLHSFSGSSGPISCVSSSSEKKEQMSSFNYTSYSTQVKSSSTREHIPLNGSNEVLCVEVYYINRRGIWVKTQEILVLGQQLLTELRDKIYCLTDQIMKLATKHDPSGYFLIEDIFYNDSRDKRATDYSKPILDWLRESKKTAVEKWECIVSGELQQKQKEFLGNSSGPKLPQLKARSMQSTRFCDLNFRLGAGYLYCHQGDCKHVMVIRDMRLIHPEDVQNRAAYPLIMFQSKLRFQKCSCCKIFRAIKVTVDDKWAPENPCYFCGICYFMLHYSDNKLIYDDFQVFDYIHD